MLRHLTLDLNSALVDPLAAATNEFRAVLTALKPPAFELCHPDLVALKAQLAPYQGYPNLIIIANGGSRTSALAFYHALGHLRNNKRVEWLFTMEPGVVASLKTRYSPADTLVMPISKSGVNVDVLEPLLQFLDYPVLPITSLESGALQAMAKRRGWTIIAHPEVGGRFSGRTASALAPAILMGLDAAAINQGAQDAYATLNYAAPSETNPAWLAASTCFQLEEHGITEIFVPIYSQPLTGFLPLIIQLIHESTGKNGQGQTVFGGQAPESQHHTNQRFFGGQRNVVGWFITVRDHQHPDLATAVPPELADIPLGKGSFGDLQGIPLATALHYDYEGVKETASQLGRPHLTLELNALTPESIGELLSFLHFFAVYSALLRGQNPFDEPAVEAAKIISLAKRRASKKNEPS